MALEPGPQVLDGIEVWSIRRRVRQLDPAARAGHVLVHQSAAVSLQAVQDNQQRSFQMLPQRSQELDEMRRADRPLVKEEQTVDQALVG